MFKKLFVIFGVLILLFSLSPVLSAQTDVQESDRIIGKWTTKSKDDIIIYKEGNVYFGRPSPKPGEIRYDDKNPDKTLRNRLLADIVNLKDFTYTKENFWSGGTIYDPNNGKTYQCHITMVSPDKIKVRGFIGISLIGRTEEWTRVKK